MLTPDDLHAMSSFERAEIFERLALQHFGPGWHPRAAHAFGVNRATIGRWISNQTTPFAPILLLQEWLRPDQGEDWRAIADNMADTARRLERLAISRDGSPG